MGADSDHRFRMDVDGRVGGELMITVHGDLDRSVVDEFEVAGADGLHGGGDVVADISAATLVDSAALATLVRLHRISADGGGHFQVVIGPNYQRSLIDVAGLAEHLNLVFKRPVTDL